MDTYENNEPIQEQDIPAPQDIPVSQEPPTPLPQYTAQPNPAAYRGTGTGRKESPYANSPYVMNHAPRQETYNPHQYEPRQHQPQYTTPKPPKKNSGFWKKTVAVVSAVALVACGCLITAASVNNYWEGRTQNTISQMNQQIQNLQDQIDSLTGIAGGTSVSGSPIYGDGLTPSQVYSQNVKSVVAISATSQITSFYGTTEGTSAGSGFILTDDGYVVTNCHVIEGATSVSVITHDGTEYPAEIIGSDSTNDVAVLKVEATGLPTAAIGSSDALVIGDMVVAIGNPLGELTSTQTVGYVSGKDRDVTTDNTIINMIQTDAAINSGNSGGPLFNMKGEVVGITTAKYSGTSGSGASIEGIGFAIPIDDVKGIIADLMDYGYVTGAYLGVTVRNTDAESAAMFGLPVGAYVETVEKGAAADRAGVQPKDIIIDLGGYEVNGITSLTRALRNFDAGDETTITVIRSGREVMLNIELDEKPQSMTAMQPGNQDSQPEGNYEEWYNWFFGNKNG